MVQVMGERTLSQAEKVKRRLQEAAREYQRFVGDTGSSEVQGMGPLPLLRSALLDFGSLRLWSICAKPAALTSSASMEPQPDKSNVGAAASLTVKIAFMAQHMDQHRKDFHSRR